ncbi:MAG: GHKL domain-containing protein [Gammaproteobacteria bacterium]|nr:GHKL domain-containing protein [Gammaproteobacteria bacterium]
MPGSRASLSARLLVVSAVMLVAAFAITIAVLDLVFRRSAEAALTDQLEMQVLALIGAAEPDEAGNLAVPRRLLEPRLRNPGSGLYGEILDASGLPLWRSPSAVGLELAPGATLRAGERRVSRLLLPDGSEVLLFGLGINWELGPTATPAFQVFAAADLAGYEAQLDRFRQQLLAWFSAVMFVLLLALWLAIRHALRPLRRMSAEISAIEAGRQEAFGTGYPRELAGVTSGLNTLLGSERQRMDRYRTTMDDLAHSLKTPLAVVRTELGGNQPDTATLRAQVDRMQAVVDYQLRRAAASGPRSLAARPVALAPPFQDIVSSLRKIHHDKVVSCELQIPEGASYPAEPGDLYEIFGNLLDNAWKWCAGRIVVTVAVGDDNTLTISVADDGPGIPDDQAEAVLGRGIRADQRGDVPGQGIGLAVVREIVGLYRGSVSIGRSALGGAELRVRLPLTVPGLA